MLTFPFGSDAKFTLIPKINDEPIPQSEMVDLTIKIEKKNRGVNFTPLWNWSDVGIDIEIQRDQIKSAATSYTVVLDWRRPDATYSDGFQDRMNYCTLIHFSTACNIVSEDTAVIEISPAYKGDSAYQTAVENGFVGTEEQWLASLKGDAFTYDDFTPEQIEELQRPATEAAGLADAAAQSANQAASGATAATQAAGAAIQNAITAKEDAEAATSSANQAAENAAGAATLAGQAAEAADEAKKNANEAKSGAEQAADNAGQKADYAKEQGDYAKEQAEIIDGYELIESEEYLETIFNDI